MKSILEAMKNLNSSCKITNEGNKKKITESKSSNLAKYIFDNFEKITGVNKNSMRNKNGDKDVIVDIDKFNSIEDKVNIILGATDLSTEDKDDVFYDLEGLLSDYLENN